MTPIARDYFKEMLTAKSIKAKNNIELLAKSRCFEVSKVTQVLRETVAVIDASKNHGGLLNLPFDFCWFEFVDKGGGFGAFAMSNGDRQIIVSPLDPDGSTYVNITDSQFDIQSKDLRPGGSYHTALWVVACIILINAAYGVEQEIVPVHRGLERVARKQGFSLQSDRIITLSLSKPPKKYEAKGGQGSSKSFHFCRAHKRRLPSGALTEVKAHWRGDPRLGISQGSYRVVP